MKKNLRQILSLILFTFAFASFSQNYWQKVSKASSSNSREFSNLDEKHYQTYQLDLDALKSNLIGAPLRGTSTRSNTTVFLPNEYGKLELFRVIETPVLSDEMSARYPNIKTYTGYSVNTPGIRARFSVTPQGLQTMLSYPDKPTSFTVPTRKGDISSYISYNRNTRTDSVKEFECMTTGEFMPVSNNITGRDANDQVLRTFRLALSAAAEYTNNFDDGDDSNGTAADDAFATAVATLNRNNEVFEVDMAVTFTLVTGTELFYTDAGTDPYGGNLNAELQTTLTAEVGEANYDIGHLFQFDNPNGNAGCIGCVCEDGSKGSGFSSHNFQNNPGSTGPYMNDFFDIDYVPHEIGHQMGGNHTWSFQSEGTGVNMEPGSGTTIMGYSGITGVNDVQDHSDPYFHYASIDQILNNLDTKTCQTETAITNNPPVADAGNDFIIPGGTAFVLTGSATDADASDALTYTWEQIDNGVTTSGTFGPTKVDGAVWRSRPPSSSPSRYFPEINRVIAGTLTETNPLESVDNSTWETVSTINRDLNFALTVRDRSEANGLGQNPQTSFDEMIVTVIDTGAPFAVTSQTTNVTWDAGTTQTVTWDVAGTDANGINAADVDISISIDGGLTFPFSVGTFPNNGSADISVPVVGGDSSTVRVRVQGTGNIFYAINSSNFTIQEQEFVLSVADSDMEICLPNDTVMYNFVYNTFLGFTGTTNFTATGLPAGASATFSPASASADGTNVSVTVSGLSGLALGNYSFNIVGTSGSNNTDVGVEFTVYDANLANLTLVSPMDGATGTSPEATILSWQQDTNAQAYEIDVATDAAFTNIVAASVETMTTYTPPTLNVQTMYFWRVRGVNSCGNGAYLTASFTTANLACSNTSATDTPIAIPDGIFFVGPGDPVTSTINVSDVFQITDVNVTVNISHTWGSDLTLTLTSPAGTSVILSEQNGGNGTSYVDTVFDSDAANPVSSGTGTFTGTFAPDGDLSVLNSEISSGDWLLTVQDAASGDTGNIESWSIEVCGFPLPDQDGDGVPDSMDNCVFTANNDQSDVDGDGLGDVCDDDIDNDGILNADDNCPSTANADQEDLDQNGIGDVCDITCVTVSYTGEPLVIDDDSALPSQDYVISVDIPDNLTITDVNVTVDIEHTWTSDLLIALFNPTGTEFVILTTGAGGAGVNFTNTTFDDAGTISIEDVVAADAPFTGVFSPENPLSFFNGQQSILPDGTNTWFLFVRDQFPASDGGLLNGFDLEICGIRDSEDFDSDGILNDDDNCVLVDNTDQADNDGDGIGDECDDDDDNDGILDVDDNCQFVANANQADNDGDGIGDECDDDDDNDGVLDDDDNCQFAANPDQSDVDNDGVGDACDNITVNDIVTPNSDGINDTWTINSIERYPGTVVRVFNRTGKEVYKSSAYRNDWAATGENGKALPSGSYYYVVDRSGEGNVVVRGWLYVTY